MFETLIFAGTVLFTQAVKKYIYPRFGGTGVHIATFTVALVGLGVYQYAQINPSFMEALVWALGYLAGAIAIYEVILKKIGFQSSATLLENDQR